MRLTTDFWVSALIRRVFGDGGFAAIVKRGATEAGAVFIIARDRMGTVRLFGPAAQTEYGIDIIDERRFSELLSTIDDTEAEARLDKEKRFDSDIWVVEIEAGRTAVEELFPLVSG
ncbi:DUF1491 family protein [Mesorhizobium sp. NBSH29]|uniref:DUF1491 family protein n=1 Tax=Mesorhizobium sp. NBSH29 TaxID=2654249 RepID=UPI00189672B3|nr:DUF1491 family protein [Mesorhizobium sp. NBSH29]QPC87190.1 DUF1491 family protein [Mesorhizobium sp. NBSH29]